MDATGPAVLRELTVAVAVPVNVLVIPGRSLAELGALGVRRVGGAGEPVVALPVRPRAGRVCG